MKNKKNYPKQIFPNLLSSPTLRLKCFNYIKLKKRLKRFNKINNKSKLNHNRPMKLLNSSTRTKQICSRPNSNNYFENINSFKQAGFRNHSTKSANLFHLNHSNFLLQEEKGKISKPDKTKTNVEVIPSIVKMTSNIKLNDFKLYCNIGTSERTASLKGMISKEYDLISPYCSNISTNVVQTNFKTKSEMLTEVGAEQCLAERLRKTNKRQLNSGPVTMSSENCTNKSYDKANSRSCMKNNFFSISEANIYQLCDLMYIFVMKPETCIYLVGIIEIGVLKGSIEVLGYCLNNPKQKLLVFSPLGTSHIFIKAKANEKPMTDLTYENKVILERLLLLGVPRKILRMILKEDDTNIIFFVSRKKIHLSTSVWPICFDNYLPFTIFPSSDLFNNDDRPCHAMESKLSCIFEGNLQDLSFKKFNEVPEWQHFQKDLIYKDLQKTILCGGKSVGKSTLLRYLINKCLLKWSSVLVLDFDLGQCEFTVGGCISVILVDEPTLGPNFTHLKEPLRSVYLGEVDVTKCPENYIEGCKFLINYAEKEYGNIPWLINTMGFTRGFGVTLTCGIIRNVQPTQVIQIESKDRKLNFPTKLDPKFVLSQNVDSFSELNNSIDYMLFTIPSGTENLRKTPPKSRGISPAEARNLVILTYFSSILNTETTCLSLVKPYMISMTRIRLQTTDKFNLTKVQIAIAMNGNMVALCNLRENDTLPNCLGFGIVRAVNWQTETIFLITPLASHTLSKINCLIKGNIALPEPLYYNQEVNHVPYLAYTSSSLTARYARRDFKTLPVKQREDDQNNLFTI